MKVKGFAEYPGLGKALLLSAVELGWGQAGKGSGISPWEMEPIVGPEVRAVRCRLDD